MAKKKAGVSEEIETQPEAIEEETIDLGEEEIEIPEAVETEDETDDTADDEEISLTDVGDEEPETVEEQPQQPDKIAGLSPEQLAKAYKNAEKLIGRLGQEVGDLRKKVEASPEAPKTPEERITAMSDADLDNALAYLKDSILKPNASIENEDYGQDVVLFNDLKEERTLRKVRREQMSTTAEVTNQKAIAEFSTAWGKALDDTKMSEVIKYAKERLSDQYGNVTKTNLEAALFNLNPALFTKSMQMATAEQERKRITEAQAKTQPRLSGAGNSVTATNTVTIKQIEAMDEWERQKFLSKLYDTNPKAFEKIQEALRK